MSVLIINLTTPDLIPPERIRPICSLRRGWLSSPRTFFEEEVARFVVFEVGKHVTGHCRSDVVCLLEEVVTSEKLKPGQEDNLPCYGLHH